MKSIKKKRNIEQYEHIDKDRLNNPEAGLVSSATDQAAGKKQYAHDPHLDPQLQWAGKTERISFEVPTVSLHVHEQIDPKRIIDEVRKEDTGPRQQSLFDLDKKPLREAVEFYKHRWGWKNRLVAGDSLLVMNSLLEKEGMAGNVQMVYFDPPYGIKYGSNFQPFVNQRNVTDGKDADLTAEPETIKAFRDTWELGIHSYLTYLRDRLLLAKELLHESGSIFVQIGDENVHRVRCLMDEVFGEDNFISEIFVSKTGSQSSNFIGNIADIILWYSKIRLQTKFRPIYSERELREETDFSPDPIKSSGNSDGSENPFEFEGKIYKTGLNEHWKTHLAGMNRLAKANRIVSLTSSIRYKRFFQDYPVKGISNLWPDLGGAINMIYVVQTATRMIERCLLMSTDPGDLVLDITCGSGTTAYVGDCKLLVINEIECIHCNSEQNWK